MSSINKQRKNFNLYTKIQKLWNSHYDNWAKSFIVWISTSWRRYEVPLKLAPYILYITISDIEINLKNIPTNNDNSYTVEKMRGFFRLVTLGPDNLKNLFSSNKKYTTSTEGNKFIKFIFNRFFQYANLDMSYTGYVVFDIILLSWIICYGCSLGC